MVKGEIARFEKFLLLSRCFQKSSEIDAYIPGKEIYILFLYIAIELLFCLNPANLKSTAADASKCVYMLKRVKRNTIICLYI